MQFLEGGAGGANGRESRTARSSDQDPVDPDAGTGHGSLMSRYRGTPQPPTTEDQATPPRTGDKPAGAPPAPASRPPTGAAEDNPWRRSTWTPTPPVPPAPPTPPPAPTQQTPRAATPAATAPPPAAPSSAPAADTPATETPAADTPAADTPGAHAPGADTPGADTPVEAPAGKSADADTSAARPVDRPAASDPPAPVLKPAATPQAATPQAATSPATTSPASKGLLDAADSAAYRRRWRDLQADFVDDPQGAVRGAGDLSREIVQALAEAIADTDRVDRWKAQDGTSGTEDLRVALRQYRTLVDRLLEL